MQEKKGVGENVGQETSTLQSIHTHYPPKGIQEDLPKEKRVRAGVRVSG